MIVKIEDNMVVECINLMGKSYDDNDYNTFGYKNEASWIGFLLKVIGKQQQGDGKFLAIADLDEGGDVQGFLLATAFLNTYSNKWVMDVRDCIVDHDKKNNAYIVKRLFDSMIEHVKAHGGEHWCAGSIRDGGKGERYAQALTKLYNAETSVLIRGTIGD